MSLSRRPRPLKSLTLMASLAMVAGCASLPAVQSPAPAHAHSLTASTPLDWPDRMGACSDARKRARQAAKEMCELSALSLVPTPRRQEDSNSAWRCSAEAIYTCSSESSVASVR